MKNLLTKLCAASIAALAATVPLALTVGALPRSVDRIFFVSTRSGSPNIFSANVDGSNARNLTNSTSSNYYLAVSPDNSKIAFTSTRDGGSNEIYVMNSDGSNLKRLTTPPVTGYQPAWSKDGTHLAYTGTAPGTVNSQVFVMNTDGSGRRQLTHDSGNDGSVSYSPDGTMVLYSHADVGGPSRLWTASAVNGSGARSISTGPYDGDAVWVGTSIVFDRYVRTSYELFVMHQDGSDLMLLASPGAQPDVSDGAVIFARGTASFELATVPLSGGTVSNFATMPGDSYDPKWANPTASGPGASASSMSTVEILAIVVAVAAALAALAVVTIRSRKRSGESEGADDQVVGDVVRPGGCPPEELAQRQRALDDATRNEQVVDDQIDRVTAEGLQPATAELSTAQADVAAAQAALNTINAEWQLIGGPSSEDKARAEGRLHQAQLHLIEARTRLDAVNDVLTTLQKARAVADAARAAAAAAVAECTGVAPQYSHVPREFVSDPPLTTEDAGGPWTCPPDEVARRRAALADAEKVCSSLTLAMQKLSLDEVTPARDELTRAIDVEASAQIEANRTAGPDDADARASALGALEEAHRRVAEATARLDAASKKLDALSTQLRDANGNRATAWESLRECEDVGALSDSGGAGTPASGRKPKKSQCSEEEIARLEKALADAIARQHAIDELMRAVNSEEFHPSNADVASGEAAVNAGRDALHGAPDDAAATSALSDLANAHRALNEARIRNDAVHRLLDVLGRQMIDADFQRAAAQEALDDCESRAANA